MDLLHLALTALAALILPAEVTFNPAILSTELTILFRKSSTDNPGSFPATKAATPATTGVAIDVVFIPRPGAKNVDAWRCDRDVLFAPIGE